jgi:hypothetical protein
MKTSRGKQTSRGRRDVVAILFSGFMLLALVFSIGLGSTRHETSGQQEPAVTGTSVETQVQPTEPLKPALIWTGKSEEDITQHRLPGHSECDLQLD